MALLIELTVERMLLRAGRVVGDDGNSARLGNGSAEVIGIVGCIRQDGLGAVLRQQGGGL